MEIRPTILEDIEGFWTALDEVARERKYLLFTEGPDIEGTRKFISDIIEKKWSQFLAVDGGQVVGWCDAIPCPYEGCTHVAKLGMGVLSSHRRQGIVEKLIKAVIEDAFSKGIERIELEVFATNQGAIALYEKIGFEHEGRKRDARRIDGISHDNLMMALLR